MFLSLAVLEGLLTRHLPQPGEAVIGAGPAAAPIHSITPARRPGVLLRRIRLIPVLARRGARSIVGCSSRLSMADCLCFWIQSHTSWRGWVMGCKSRVCFRF
jgi:hypothetical protein